MQCLGCERFVIYFWFSPVTYIHLQIGVGICVPLSDLVATGEVHCYNFTGHSQGLWRWSARGTVAQSNDPGLWGWTDRIKSETSPGWYPFLPAASQTQSASCSVDMARSACDTRCPCGCWGSVAPAALHTCSHTTPPPDHSYPRDSGDKTHAFTFTIDAFTFTQFLPVP